MREHLAIFTDRRDGRIKLYLECRELYENVLESVFSDQTIVGDDMQTSGLSR